MSTVREIEEAISRLDARDQVRLLRDLPSVLQIQLDDVAWLEASERSFEFWDNDEDAVYDEKLGKAPPSMLESILEETRRLFLLR